MSKLFVLFLSVLPVISVAEDFVMGTWGDSREQIDSIELKTNITPIGQFDYLAYKTDILNLINVRVIYSFDQNQLTKGVFIFPTQSAIESIDQYQQINMILEDKYGAPEFNQPVFADSVPEADWASENWPMLLQTEQLIFQGEWLTDRTHIRHQLASKGGKIYHQLVYEPAESVMMEKTDSAPF